MLTPVVSIASGSSMGASSPRVGSASHHTHNPFSQARHWLCSGPAKARCWRIASLVGAVIVVHLVASVAVGTLNVGSSNSSHAAASSTSYSYAASSFGPRSLYSLSTSKAAASRNALSPSQSRTYSNPLLAKELGGNSTEPETDAEASAIAKEAAEDAAYAAAAARAAGNITERANPESAWPQPDLDGTASAPTAAVRKEALLDRLRKRKEAFARQRAEREQAQVGPNGRSRVMPIHRLGLLYRRLLTSHPFHTKMPSSIEALVKLLGWERK